MNLAQLPLLLALAASASAANEVPGVGPSMVVRAEVGELSSVMAALKVHGGEPEPGFVNDFQPYVGGRFYANGTAQYAWETVGGPEKRLIVWVDDPQDREPYILILHAVFRRGGGGTLSVFRTNPSGTLLSAMHSELVPYSPAGYSGAPADSEFAAQKAYWKTWEAGMRGKPRGEGRP